MCFKRVTAILGFAMLLSLFCHSQSRTAPPTVKFEKKTSKLLSAKGWEKNEATGNWIGNDNAIGKLKISWDLIELHTNFKWIQFAIVKHNDKTYYVLTWEIATGEWKYPNIQEDWESEKETHFAVFDSADYATLKKSVEWKQGADIYFRALWYGDISNKYRILGGEYLYNENNLLGKLSSAMYTGHGDYSYCFRYNSQTVDGKDVVRFLLPNTCDEVKDLSNKYFEVPLADFRKLLTL